jgi:hypothetical protein
MKEHEWKGVGIQLNMNGVGVELNCAKKFGTMFSIIFKSNYGLSKIIMHVCATKIGISRTKWMLFVR